MRISIITRITAVDSILFAITFIISVATTGIIYAQNTTMTQQTNYTSATNTTTSSINGPNATRIVDAINAELRLMYGDNSEKSADSATTTIKIKHE